MDVCVVGVVGGSWRGSKRSIVASCFVVILVLVGRGGGGKHDHYIRHVTL
jgi:hypothetical protein